MIEYRLMKPGDIGAGLRLCRMAGWNQVERDWQLFLQLSPLGCFVATSNNKIVGTVATISYQDFSWIGMVLVDMEYRRQGIGMQLLQNGLQLLQKKETVKLDATPEGRELYLNLNFFDEYRLSRMSATVIDGTLNSLTARLIDEKDLEALVKYDERIFGANRTSLLEWMWAGARKYSFLVEEQNQIQGYCLGREGYTFDQIGPVVAKNCGIAKRLVSSALHNCTARPVIIDAPHFDKEWMKWLSLIGFTEQRAFISMYRGSNHFGGIYENQFAITGPEFG